MQQHYWQRETDKLWVAATTNNQTFEFKTIDDVLEENAGCKEEILRLSDIIDEELDNLKEDVSTNKEAIVHIEDNFSAIASEVTLNTKHIGDNADEVQLTCLYNVE